ncbi:hypothetical protein FN976_22675 [Caenimonas sedimenti]|uniref:Uncharacterized protein n=1 Tax=Caenimonas sedimenti TaxID=2596921 RepID=A0A562ZIM5_9BURK|nr:hypothetical protein [Caenimonas sedimenti]TWO68440.1 hypothetical protein FN976_22675 [Caenimonas sedimenti]
MVFRSVRPSPLLTPVVSAMLALALWALAPFLLGRDFRTSELLLVAALAVPLLEWARRRWLRREREAIESLRDSALW